MLKYVALLFNTLALLIYQFFFADGITVTQNVPSKAKPDTEFTVELTINKGTIGGFAKLQQELPEGFTAVQDENNGASFTFTNQAVKFIWMSLPSDKEFKIKARVNFATATVRRVTTAARSSDGLLRLGGIAAPKESIGGDFGGVGHHGTHMQHFQTGRTVADIVVDSTKPERLNAKLFQHNG